jgi:DNA-binding GntR family transcriptional regulator
MRDAWDAESQGGESSAMKKSIVLSLTDEELQDLYRVLIDRDAEEALRFLDQHLRRKVHQALEGG